MVSVPLRSPAVYTPSVMVPSPLPDWAVTSETWLLTVFIPLSSARVSGRVREDPASTTGPSALQARRLAVPLPLSSVTISR